jgi:hypothetical protein
MIIHMSTTKEERRRIHYYIRLRELNYCYLVVD